MSKPKNPDQVPRLRWSPEEMDLLIREVAVYLVTAERNGKQITKNEALALAQHVLPRERQREIGPDYNPRWMSSEGRLEAVLEQVRATATSATAAAPAAESSLAPAPARPPVEEPPMPKPAAKADLKSSTSRELQPEGPARKDAPPSPAVLPGLEEALGGGVLAGALRSLVTKALAGLLSDVLRQPEVQAALREAVASALAPVHPAGEDAVQPASRPGPASRTVQEVQEESRAARDAPPPESDDEPPPADPNAWQPTPFEALPQRGARGASEPPKPSVLLFGLLPRDQQKLRADFADKYNLRFGSPHKARNLGDDLRKIDKVYALVRFIPKDLDRSLSACGVPYGPVASVGELRQDLTLNPPLSRAAGA